VTPVKILSVKTQKSKNSCSVSGEGVGAEGMEVSLPTDRHARTNDFIGFYYWKQ